MTNAEMIKRCPDMAKITQSVLLKVIHKIGYADFDFGKTWADNGFDDLDGVEVIMELEKELGIHITDEVADAFIRYDQKPAIFTEWVRNEKLKQLGI